MNIEARYTTDVRRTLRATRRVRRRLRIGARVIGVVFLLLALLALRQPVVAVIFAVVGAVIFVEVDVILWLRVRRNREVFVRPVVTTLTDAGISQRTSTTAVEFPWDMVRRVIETKDFWIFVINRLQTVVLTRQHLTPEQQAELTAFLTARRQALHDAPHPAAGGDHDAR